MAADTAAAVGQAPDAGAAPPEAAPPIQQAPQKAPPGLPPIPPGFEIEKPGARTAQAAPPKAGSKPLPPIPPGFEIEKKPPTGVPQLPTIGRPAPNSPATEAFGRAANKAFQAGQDAYNAYFGFSPDVDYSAGLPFSVLTNLDRMDNEEERVNYLTQVFGKDAIKRDPANRIVVSTDALVGKGYQTYKGSGKKGVAVDYGPLGKRIGAELVATAPETLGMMLLPEGLGLLGAGGKLMRFAGAATGAGVGKAVDEAAKRAYDQVRKTPAQEADTLAYETLVGLIGEGAAQGLRGTGRFILRGYSPYIEPERKAMVSQLLRRGLVPTVSQAAPVSFLLPYEQNLAKMLFGDKVAANNAKVLSNEIKTKLRQIGVSDQDMPAVFRSITDGDIPTAEINEGLVSSVQQYRSLMEQSITGFNRQMREQVDRDFSTIDRLIDRPPPELATPEALQGRIGDEIWAERDKLSNWAREQYTMLDSLMPGPSVPTSTLKTQAQAVFESLPKTQGVPESFRRVQVETPRGKIWRTEPVPGQSGKPVFVDEKNTVLEMLQNIRNLPETITFQEASTILSQIAKFNRDPNLLRTVGERNIAQLEKGADAMFDNALIADNTTARLLFDQTRKTYADGIAKFKDTLAQRLIKEAGQRGSIEPEAVVNTLIRDGQSNRVLRIKRMVSPETWQAVKRADWDDIVRGAADDSGVVKGDKLLRALKARGATLEAVYGDDMAGKMRVYASKLASLDAKVPADRLALAGQTGDQGFRILTEQATRDAQILDKTMKEELFARLGTEGAPRDGAVEWIIQQGHPERIRQAISYFGENSPQWQQIRILAMQKLLRGAVNKDADILTTLFRGSGLRDSIEGMGMESLEAMFGKNVAADLKKFSEEIAFISRDRRNWAGALRAGTLAFHPLSHLSAIAEVAALGHLMTQPGFIRWLALGADGNRAAWRAIAATTQAMADEIGQQTYEQRKLNWKTGQ